MSDNFKKGEWIDGQWTPSDDDDELPAAPRGAELSPEDHELLVLAARAFGADFVEVENEGYGNLNFPGGPVIPAWNPLRFSGDCFDLGVRLDLFNESADFTYKLAEEIGRLEEGEDRVPAARRALVRAAAGITRFRRFLNESS